MDNFEGFWRKDYGARESYWEIRFHSNMKIGFRLVGRSRVPCFCDAGGCDEKWVLIGNDLDYQIANGEIIISCPEQGLIASYSSEHEGHQPREQVIKGEFSIFYEKIQESLNVTFTYLGKTFNVTLDFFKL